MLTVLTQGLAMTRRQQARAILVARAVGTSTTGTTGTTTAAHDDSSRVSCQSLASGGSACACDPPCLPPIRPNHPEQSER
jgi:hypothetical protein